MPRLLKLSQQITAFLVCLAIGLLPSLYANAQDADKPSNEKFRAGLNAAEAYLNHLEQFGDYSVEPVHHYAQELINEYRFQSNGNETTARQKEISVKLWQLQRMGQQIASQGQDSSSSFAMDPEFRKLNELYSEHRKVTLDRALRDRYFKLIQRFHERRNRRYSHSGRSFHFITPDGEETSKPDQDNRFDADFEMGAIQSFHQPISALLKLSVRDGSLYLDREHWKTAFGGRDLAVYKKELEEHLQQLGVELPKPNGRRVVAGQRSLTNTPLNEMLFDDFQYKVSKSSSGKSSSSSGSGKAKRRSFNCDTIESQMRVSSDGKFSLTVQETEAPERVLKVTGGPGNQLSVSLTGDHVLLLDQADDGSVRWVDIGEKEVVVHRADSFAQLYSEHKDLVEKLLFPRLAHNAIGLPEMNAE